MVDEAKLCSSIHSTFEGLIVQCVVRYCHAEELGAAFGISYRSAEHASQM